jgi:hypothetical protein
VDPGAQLGVGLEGVHEFSGAADAGPVVVPESRYEPGAISREDQIWQVSLFVKATPRTSLVGSRLDQDVAPPGIELRSRRVVEYDVRSAGLQIAEPPRLRGSVLPENAKETVVVVLRDDVGQGLAIAAALQLERGVGIEDLRERAPERNRAPVLFDPTGIPLGADAPLATIFGAPLVVLISGDRSSLISLIGHQGRPYREERQVRLTLGHDRPLCHHQIRGAAPRKAERRHRGSLRCRGDSKRWTACDFARYVCSGHHGALGP